MESRGGFISSAVGEAFSMMADAEQWPEDDVALFEPDENDQALVYEYADCLSSRAFLKMCSLPFRVEHRPNAQNMSPSGTVPFLKVGKLLVAGLLPMVDLVARKGIRLSDELADFEKADMQAHIALVQQVLKNSEIYVCWVHNEVRMVTHSRFGSVYPWPLSKILPIFKEREIVNQLRTCGYADKTIEQVLFEVDKCCRALSMKLHSKEFFCGDSPTELDALVFGHLYTILTTELPDVDLANIVKHYQNLVDFCKRVDKTYFTRKG